MQFRVLGPLGVAHEGQRIDVGGPRQQVVLAVLLLSAPQLVAVDTLVDAVWPQAPPATARAQIQICISRLRQRLEPPGEPARILTRPPGYVVDLTDAELDLHQFERAVQEAKGAVGAGRPDDAAQLLRRALELWQGPPLVGIDSPPVRDAAARLAERRLSVLEDFLDLELGQGRHADVVHLAGTEVDRHPLRERLRSQLMLALYRAGRPAEALQEYHRARRVVVEELGLEPGEDLRRLEQAVLRNDPCLLPSAPRAAAAGSPREAPATPPPRMLPAVIADFTGRDDAVQALSEALSKALREPEDGLGGQSRGRGRTADGSVPIAVLSGPAGVGKSALAVHTAHRLAELFPDGQLYAAMHGTSAPLRPEDVLGRFLRALGVPGGQVPETLDERSELFRARLVGRRFLVVLDDIDAVSQVLPLLPPDGCSAVLATTRRRVTSLPGATRVELASFTPEQAVELLERVVGDARVRGEPDAARELVRLCGYLPLAVRIVASRLAARPHWPLAAMVERLSDEARQLHELRHEDLGVRASLMLAYETLHPDARELLRLLSLVDAPDLGSWAATAVLDRPAVEAQDLLDELVEMHLVDVAPGRSAASVRFRLHDLVRLFAREQASLEDDTARREQAIGRYLATLLHLLDHAHQRVYGGRFLVLHGAARQHELDPRLTAALLADPLEWLSAEHHALTAAVTQAAAAGRHDLCWDLAVSSVTLFEARALYDDWRATHDTALASARVAGDRFGEAVVRYSQGSLNLFQHEFAPARVNLEGARRAFEALGSRQGVAMVLRNQAIVERLVGHPDAARELDERALAIFVETGDRVGQAHVLSSLAQLDVEHGRDQEALARLTEAARICAEVSNRRVSAQVAQRLGEIHLTAGRWDDADRAFEEVLAFAEQTGDPMGEVYGLVGYAAARLGRGRPDGIAGALHRANALARQLGEPRLQARILTLLSAGSLADGRVDDALAPAAEAVDVARPLSAPALLAAAQAQLGDVHAAAGHRTVASGHWRSALDHLDGSRSASAVRLADRLRGRLGESQSG